MENYVQKYAVILELATNRRVTGMSLYNTRGSSERMTLVQRAKVNL